MSDSSNITELPVVTDQSGFRRPEIQARYERYMKDHHGELDVPNLCETMWQSGEGHAVKLMGEFIDVGPRIEWLEERFRAIHRLLDLIWARESS